MPLKLLNRATKKTRRPPDPLVFDDFHFELCHPVHRLIRFPLHTHSRKSGGC